MNLFRTARLLGLCLVLWAAVCGGGPAARAAELWGADPANGAKICIMSKDNDLTLVSVSWSGPVADGLAEGPGSLIYVYKDKSGQEIKVQGSAELKAGKLNGRASLQWSTGYSYDGYYQDGWRNGHGVLKGPDGSVYEGEWKNGVREGRGVLKASNGTVYEGEWKNDKPEGQGTVKGYDGGSYEGEWKNGKYDGHGVYKWPDGSVYEGEWKNGVREGRGVLKNASGQVVYDGLWKDNKPLEAPAQPGGAAAEKAAKVLGIPWGASEDEARRIMEARPHTRYVGTEKAANNTVRQKYTGPFNDDPAEIFIHFYQGKMFAVSIFHYRSPDQVLDKFNEMKAGMSERYGPPVKESGKYLDSSAWWSLDPNHRAGLIIVRDAPGQNGQLFTVMLSYWQADLGHLIGGSSPGGSGGKDY